MGNSTSSTTSTHTIIDDEASSSGLTCPVTGKSSSNNHPFTHKPTTTTETEAEGSACPVAHGARNNNSNSEQYKYPHSYNVYGEKIDGNGAPKPATTNQQQQQESSTLDKERLQSTIRKGGTEGVWLYPSEQMFYNALKRKNKAHGITEEDMNMLVQIHNGTNERAWKKVMEWEKAFHKCECEDPTLLKFLGKPSDITPKAWVKSTVMGYPKPFDRHDWIVDRCGKQVRYILDFYYDDDSESENGGAMTLVKNEDGFLVPKHVHIDVRPALDGFEGFYDRFRFMFVKKQDI